MTAEQLEECEKRMEDSRLRAQEYAEKRCALIMEHGQLVAEDCVCEHVIQWDPNVPYRQRHLVYVLPVSSPHRQRFRELQDAQRYANLGAERAYWEAQKHYGRKRSVARHLRDDDANE